jgi:hypothetical protein
MTFVGDICINHELVLYPYHLKRHLVIGSHPFFVNSISIFFGHVVVHIEQVVPHMQQKSSLNPMILRFINPSYECALRVHVVAHKEYAAGVFSIV